MKISRGMFDFYLVLDEHGVGHWVPFDDRFEEAWLKKPPTAKFLSAVCSRIVPKDWGEGAATCIACIAEMGDPE